MNNEFRLPNENPGGDQAKRRVVDLIEDIRADIDFELDDAVTNIVRDLPEVYFQRIAHEDQVIHLKGLLATRICQLSGELFLPSNDGNQIAVLGRENYTGQLAKILSKLPGKETRLIGANIYTSKSHDFILDVFEFSDEEDLSLRSADPLTVELLSTAAAAPTDQVTDFLARMRPSTIAQGDGQNFAPLFAAYQSLSTDQISVKIEQASDSVANVIVAVNSPSEKRTFENTAALISQYGLDIQQAELEILRMDRESGMPATARSDKSILMNFNLAATNATVPAAETWRADLERMLANRAASER